MTKVVKEEFEKLKSSDDSFTCNTSLEIFYKEFNRMNRMDDDFFTYEVEIPRLAEIPCDFKKEYDSEQHITHGSDDDMEYDASDVEFAEWLTSKFYNHKTMDQYTRNALWIYWTRGDDEVELTDEESSDSDDKDEVAEIFRIDTNIFDFETPMCKAFKEFNYLLQINPDVLTKNIDGFKTYEDYKDDWIYEWNKDVPWVHERPWTDTRVWEEPTLVRHYSLEDDKLKDEALKNKSIMKGMIDEDDKEAWRRWDDYENTIHDHDERENEGEQENEERCKLFDNPHQETPVCNIRKFEMIKYSFDEDEEYVAVKEHEYDDLISTNKDACRTYQEIFRRMNE
uniref:VIER F-box protein 2 n=1 Tax=Tanacetum cinerariifolium TaxID=118510 RepID=A0A699H8P2_TANCI|nr:VIER F-box protein 2 [Tanacetum cinerariifolium]